MKNIALVKDYNRKKHSIKYYKYNFQNHWDAYSEKGQNLNHFDSEVILRYLREDTVVLVDKEPEPKVKKLYYDSEYARFYLVDISVIIQYGIVSGLKLRLDTEGMSSTDIRSFEKNVLVEGKQKELILKLMGESE